jgi:hypothetical protein
MIVLLGCGKLLRNYEFAERTPESQDGEESYRNLINTVILTERLLNTANLVPKQIL